MTAVGSMDNFLLLGNGHLPDFFEQEGGSYFLIEVALFMKVALFMTSTRTLLPLIVVGRRKGSMSVKEIGGNIKSIDS